MAFFVELLEAEHNDVWAEIVRDFLGVELRKYLSVKPKAEKMRLRALFDTMRSEENIKRLRNLLTSLRSPTSVRCPIFSF
jgi:hypothetical protein